MNILCHLVGNLLCAVRVVIRAAFYWASPQSSWAIASILVHASTVEPSSLLYVVVYSRHIHTTNIPEGILLKHATATPALLSHKVLIPNFQLSAINFIAVCQADFDER